jgi:curved DNA-binding protein CbpA
MNFYEILEVRKDAGADAIRSAYRRLARLYHPDVTGTPDSVRFLEIQHAYETLCDPAARLAYDRSLEATIPVRVVHIRPRSTRVEPLINSHRAARAFDWPPQYPFPERDPFEQFYRLLDRLFQGF